MPVRGHSIFDVIEEEEEEEAFAVLCVYSQLLCVGTSWCWQVF